MNSLLKSTLLLSTAVSALEKLDTIQKPLIRDACPSNSILNNGECQPSSTLLADISLHQNITQQTLQQSYESARQTPNFPWTYWPLCYSNENTTEPYCVFSSQEFASGRGIFIVSSADKAYEILKKPAFSDPEALSRINNHANPPFIQHEFPGKGRGLVANKTLHRGDQIFASTPLLITNPNSYLLSETERLALVHRGVETLPEKSKPLFWALLDHFKGDAVDDRINTNAFEININGELQHAVLPEIAMLNHDCRPNAAYFWDEDTLSHYVHATQTIYPGEEITITYINNERVRSKRVKNLEANWGFQCSCSSCAAHPEFVSQSDARIKQMLSIIDKLNDWTSDSEATPEMAELLIALYTQERLDASLGIPYKHAAEAYASFGDRWQATRFARLAVEFLTLDKGWGDSDVAEMEKMATEPEMTWSWRKRVGHKRLEGVSGCGHAH
ncbi:hypothetical protein B0J11DRAFT_66286 [Dendryphion nanum]|uniref:SET domain-containing protein n=1 Tax=Dendryphion nanum TaxID=256645 RepID=A0A9P9IF95_9PLEO|nr:hypothetical protein B0J11DRAFT_66286 [Dendryphion nanum]